MLKAGIPNEEITRVYKSMYVHTEGFIRVIKEISTWVNESNLAVNELHLSRQSIVTAIWKIYQQLLEHVHHTDYKLLITRSTQDMKHQVEELSARIVELSAQIVSLEADHKA